MSEDNNNGSSHRVLSSDVRMFHNLSIAVIVERDNHGENLIRQIQSTRARVRHIWPMPEEIPIEFDIVFCAVVGDLASRFKNLPGSEQYTLIAVIPPNGNINQKALENCVPHAVIQMPCKPEHVLSSMIVGRSHYQYERRLRRRIDKLDDNLRSMRTIERAKVLVMRSKDIDEEQAYKQLRARAMQKRVSIGVLASSIVDSAELIG
jgi:AmiR/NasT family two-component response regulator